MLERLLAVAALVAVVALALLVLRLVVLVALALGYVWLTRRGAGRDAATR